jgi:hypothetical protein
MRKLVGTAVLLVAICVSPAMAKEGLSIGGSLSYTNIFVDSRDQFDQAYFRSLKPGLGWGLRVGWGVYDYLAIEASLTRSYHKTSLLGRSNLERQVLEGESLILKIYPGDLLNHFDIKLPRLPGGIDPFIIIGGGLYQIGDTGGTYYKGSGFEFGIGLDWYLTSYVSVDAGFSGRSMTFDKGEFSSGKNADASTNTFDISIAYHF